MSDYLPIKFKDNTLTLLDQRRLPHEEVFLSYTDLEGGFSAIKEMVVRGAPCIGFTGIFSMALWLKSNPHFSMDDLNSAASFLKSARPTAVNLAFEVEKSVECIKSAINSQKNPYDELVNLGHYEIKCSELNNRKMAQIAEDELAFRLNKKTYNILTHCNTGFLACGSIGTALGVVQQLHEHSKINNVWVDETRPYLQGSRLTAYELAKLGVPHQVVVEGAASHLMRTGQVDAIFVGADRIVANGDTANKIGTSNLSIIANYYNIPIYVVAPASSFDLTIGSGEGIEIELRDPKEILDYKDIRIAPAESKAFNPSFDITEGKLITGIISEKGIAKDNYVKNLPGIVI